MVEQEGYACDIAISGAHAIEMAKNGNYCLVLMDLVMSPLDGWTTSKTLRILSPPSTTPSAPRIVAVTGLPVDEGLRAQCADAGMDDVVQKPVSQKLLNNLLSKHTMLLDR